MHIDHAIFRDRNQHLSDSTDDPAALPEPSFWSPFSSSLCVAFSWAYLWRIIWFPWESDIDKMRVILIHASFLFSSSSERWTAPPPPEMLLSCRICLASQYIYWRKLSLAIVFFFNGYAVVALNSISRMLIKCYYLRLPMSSLQWTLIDLLSSLPIKTFARVKNVV